MTQAASKDPDNKEVSICDNSSSRIIKSQIAFSQQESSSQDNTNSLKLITAVNKHHNHLRN